jgi:hypothetical protein
MQPARRLLALVLFMSLGLARAAYAQAGIAVESSGGVSTTAAAKTSVQFDAPGSPSQTVNLITEMGVATASGSNGAYATASGFNFKTLCKTPCSLNLDPGFYQLKFGSDLVDPVVDLSASGGAKRYEIKPGSPGGFLLGCALSAVGLLVATYGISFYALHHGKADAVIGAVGLGATVGGFVWAMGTFGEAHEVPPR